MPLFEIAGQKLTVLTQSNFALEKNLQAIVERNLETVFSCRLVQYFFAGSGTTAHAVLEFNKEDGGNRQFILCEQMDYIETRTRERVRRVIEQNGEQV